MVFNPGSRRPWQGHVDMYRKIPTDLMEGTARGSILSYLSLILMVVLFIWETRAYFETSVITDLALDKTDDPRLRLNFNVTMTDLRCDWAVIDVVSVLGTDQNVTAHVTKWNIDGDGIRKGYKGRNRNQKDIEMYDTAIDETLEELHLDGVDAVSLDDKTLAEYKRDHEYVFVDFFAAWCSHCMTLAPTWEALAEVMTEASSQKLEDEEEEHGDDDESIAEHHYSDEDYKHAIKLNLPVAVAKVDCVDNKNVCNQQENIMAYPTLRLFIDGKTWPGGSDYKGHRTVMEMVDWLMHMEEQHKSFMAKEGDQGDIVRNLHVAHESAKEYMGIEEEGTEKKNAQKESNTKKRNYHEWKEADHPGCQITGHLMLDRVPGNFHILARSKHHDLAPHLTNVSHQVNSLTIGDPYTARIVSELANSKNAKGGVPQEVSSKMAPMNGNLYTTYNLHESYHHYLKVVSTNVPEHSNSLKQKETKAYQIIPSSQLSYYRKDMVPEAKFVYDLSPISVTYRTSSRQWYEYMTSLFAIIGGVFTMVGLIESSIQATVSKVNSNRRRSSSHRTSSSSSSSARY